MSARSARQIRFDFGERIDRGPPPFLQLCGELGVSLTPGWPDAFGCALLEIARGRGGRPLRTVSLFTGAGGLDIGFHDLGFDIIEMVEVNTRYAETLQINARDGGYFGHGEVLPIDVRGYRRAPCRRADATRSAATDGQIDLVIGGPPCQTFSAAGRRAAGVRGTTEQRGTLFEEYVRILSTCQPRAFVFENVYGITGAEAGKAWDRIKAAFASVGYRLFYRILDSADYGVPQHRERMFIVGLRTGEFRFPKPTHGPDSPGDVPFYTAGDAVEGAFVDPGDEPPALNGKYAHLLEEVPPGLNYSFFTEKMGHPRPLFAWRSKFSDFLYKADPDMPVRTLKAFCGQYTGPFHWASRRFTIAELKRLQTFPDSYAIAGSRGLVSQQIGNSVPPQIARVLALAVMDHVFGVPPPVPLPYLAEHEVLGFRKRKRALSAHYKKTAARAIARAAERGEGRDTAARSLSATYTCEVDARFRFHRSQEGLACRVLVEARPQSVCIKTTSDRRRSREAFIIDVTPGVGRGWVLPVSRVALSGTQLEHQCFVCVWKALDTWLSEGDLKDDLVQLCGYFAYEPAIACSMRIAAEHSDWRWQLVSRVVAGSGVRAITPGSRLAAELEVRQAQLKEALIFLRALGYEVRSELTNPQIPKGHFLIPYSFPTFNHRSVQLHKALF